MGDCDPGRDSLKHMLGHHCSENLFLFSPVKIAFLFLIGFFNITILKQNKIFIL